MNRVLFKKVLDLTVGNSFFQFGNNFYRQIEGLGMGLPLSPVFASIFMGFHEKMWLNDCPSDFKPFFYRRYVDDTFLIFKHKSHAQLFFDYLNNKHANIKFTMETEINGKLSFLDCLVERQGTSLSSSVFRKKTFSGLGTSFFSFTPLKFKLNPINTFLTRAFNISSNHTNLCRELSFLQDFFFNNAFPRILVISKIREFISNRFKEKPISFDVPKKVVYLSLPYFGEQSDKLGKNLVTLLNKYFFHVEFKTVFTNKFTIGSFFQFKDILPLDIKSKIIYKYSCPQNCGGQYVGSTTRNFRTRMFEHMGISPRTERRLGKPAQSSIRDHCERCDKTVDRALFKIISGARDDLDLRITESLLIKQIRPNLNNMDSAYPLKLV